MGSFHPGCRILRQNDGTDVVSVNDFDIPDDSVDDIKHDHAALERREDVGVTLTPASVGFGSGVETGTEVIVAATELDNAQRTHLRGQAGFTVFRQGLLQFGSEIGEKVCN